MRKGQKASLETRMKMSIASKGRRHSEETKRLMSEKGKLRIPQRHTEETKARISAKLKGRIVAKRPFPEEKFLGAKYGSWTILSFSEEWVCGKRSVLCRCNCGKERVIILADLKYRKSTKCQSCSRKETYKKWLNNGTVYKNTNIKNGRWRGDIKGIISGQHWSRILQGAYSRKLTVSITIDDAVRQWERQSGKCAYTGIDLVMPVSEEWKKAKESVENSRGVLFSSASLDRINPHEGYTVSNIQWVSAGVNLIKWYMTEKEFLETIELIYKHKLERKCVS